MAWRSVNVKEQRLQFVVLAKSGEKTVRALCEEFGISRMTGHKWINRFESEGAAGVMEERSRRPQRSPNRAADQVEAAVVEMRQRYPDWGARKLNHLIRKQKPELGHFAVATTHRILLRHGLVSEEDRHRPASKRFERSKPNELWQMDFKGPKGFHSEIGPLSILDDHSRYLVTLKQLGSTRLVGVQGTLRDVFGEVGLPEAMLVDHGTPWWNPKSVWGWTELTIWLMRQGIRMSFSGIRHPQTQGKVERMHGSMYRTIRKRQPEPNTQQWLDQFREEYNCLRPHEAIGMATPSQVWSPSSRLYLENPRSWEYPDNCEVIQLGTQGEFHWQHRRWELGRPFKRLTVGVQRVDHRALVYYCATPLVEIDLRSQTQSRLPACTNLVTTTENRSVNIPR